MNQPALEMKTKNDYVMSHEVKIALAKIFCVITFSNVVNYVIAHYHDMLGALFTTVSILYLLWKWRREYKKDKLEEERGRV